MNFQWLKWVCAVGGLAWMSSAGAATISVTGDLQQAIDQANDYDVLELSGHFTGRFHIDKPLSLVGRQATLSGAGQGHVLTVEGQDVTLMNLIIEDWGGDLTEIHSGILVKENSQNVQLINNQLTGPGFGIYVLNSQKVQVKGNRVTGDLSLRSADRGNGIHLSGVTHSVVDGNSIKHTRDGVYIINSQHNQILGNHMRELRYGVHYMYSHNNAVIGNHSEHVRAGFALMSSRNLKVANNVAIHCTQYGLLLNFVTYSEFYQNKIDHIRVPESNAAAGNHGKALFVYNSQYNTFKGNRFSNSDLGVHLTAGSEGNVISENAFVQNQTQVKYVATRTQEWSESGKGNYWSNYLGWDLNQDHIGDSPFEPNDGMDKVLWKYPEAKILMDSPAVLMLRWVQRSFPVFKSVGVTDSHPIFRASELSTHPSNTDLNYPHNEPVHGGS